MTATAEPTTTGTDLKEGRVVAIAGLAPTVSGCDQTADVRGIL